MKQDSQGAEILSAGDIRCLCAYSCHADAHQLPARIKTPGARPLFRLVYKPRPKTVSIVHKTGKSQDLGAACCKRAATRTSAVILGTKTRTVLPSTPRR